MRASGKVVTGTVPHREVQEVTGTFPSSLEQIGSKQFQEHKKLKKKVVDAYFPTYYKVL